MDIEFIILFGGFIVIAIYVMADSARKRKARIEKKLKNSYGKPSVRKYSEDEFELIKHFYEESAKESYSVDDITWNDLGMDDIYKAMNISNSSAGQECLYKMLRVPEKTTQKLRETDRLAEFFDSDEQRRLEVQRKYVKLGFTRVISLSDYLGLISELNTGNNAVHYLAIIVLLAAILVCLFVDPVVGIFLIIGAISFSVISYYKYKANVEPYFICIRQLVNMLSAAKGIAELKYDELESYNAKFNEINTRFSSIVKNSFLLSTGNVDGSIVEMLLDYIRMLTHVDLIKFNNMIKKLAKHEEEMYELMNTLGYLEACISIASFRKWLPYWCRPEFTGMYDKNSGKAEAGVTIGGGVKVGGTGLELKEVFHPMIEEPVSNSIKADKHILITGSNASGKSTFLKTVAINAVLAQTIFTSTSKEYRAPMYRIYSSMSLKDDLSSNCSYYIVEIKSLKRILDAVEHQNDEDKRPVLCFVDEVLRGTNTVERIAASSEILKSLRYKNVLCFAATHDIELTAILEKFYDNYHFQEEVTDDDVKFNYKLFKGPATTRNAIKLLKIMGYDRQITDGADRQAMYFMDNGIWQM